MKGFTFIPLIFIFFGLLSIETGCKKEIVERTVSKDTVIQGNKSPIYNGISSIKVDAFINKAYIDFCGRKPNSQEFSLANEILKSNPTDTSLKIKFIKSLESKREYFKRLADLINIKLINSTDSPLIVQQINTNRYQYDLVKKQNDYLAMAYFQNLIYYNKQLIMGVDSLYQNNLSYREFIGLYLKCYFYDEINMGAENYVKACFNNLYSRSPNKDELQQGVLLYDNKPAFLFTKAGVSKSDLIQIILYNPEFYQGFINDTYIQLLQRKASSIEIYKANILLERTNNYKKTRRDVIISKEYAGF